MIYLTSLRRKDERTFNLIIKMNYSIQKLIQNNTINEPLWLAHAPITKLPNNIKYVNGSVYLHYSKITQLPNNLTITGGLNLNSTPIKKLPKKLTIHGGLSICHTQIDELPDDIFISIFLDCHATPLAKKYNKKELEVKCNTGYPNTKIFGVYK